MSKMRESKDISMESYQWGHFGAIMFDVILGTIIFYCNYKNRNTLGKKVTFWAACILILFSLLGLIPVFQNYDEIRIKKT